MTLNLNIACTTCAQAFEHADNEAAGLAILFMLIIIVPILAVIGFCIVRIARRQKDHFDPQYQDSFDPSQI